MMDAGETLLIGSGVALGVLLVVVALRWRRVAREGPALPLWGFLRHEGITRGDAADNTSATAVMQAELSCSVCSSRAECRARLATRRDAVPPANCPNAVLLDDFGIAVEKSWK
jgi:hypothetical protein